MPGAGETLVGVDIGTSSTKGVAVSPGGRVLARASRPHGLSLPRAGYAEQDAETDWWQGCRDVVRELVEAVGAGAVRGVCVSGTGPCLLPCDARGRPLRPGILYGIDTRASAEISELEAALGGDEIVARSGSALSSQALGPKLLWLRRREPDVWSRMASWHMPSSFAAMRLCGEIALDHHSASQCDPFYDLAAGGWAEDWVGDALPGCPLPQLVWPGEQIGAVTADAGVETGLRPGTPVFAGTIDAWSEALSVGVRRPGDLMLMYGSTLFVVQVADGAVSAAPPLWCTQGVEPGRPSYAGGMATAGTLLAWWRETLGAPEWDAVLAETAASPPGARGLLALPYFAGERTPIDDPRARGVIAGLSLQHTRGDVMRAAHEAIAFGVRGMLETLGRAAGPARRIVAVGGGLQGGLLAQIVSDVAGVEQLVPEETIGASYGDALLAAIGAGLVEREAAWARVIGVVAPDPDVGTVYDELAPLHADLYRATTAVVHPLADRQTADGGT
ncbi:FGGY-family carbohydrate kinase [Capillimicrobium parvum]|uniref:Xylulose kinase n=1 Tax=Capillimicrobium parvum TaxID=2884022 RepID=A0A9E6XSY3_9ACTN|nr:FGGY family carbohydrate kinase [Capillimicrobium parvum]UGS34059.1 Xylulose kinase [Capillimicrobium parvum]